MVLWSNIAILAGDALQFLHLSPHSDDDLTWEYCRYFVLTSYILSLVELLDLFWFLVYNGDAKGLL